jgi:hypothetical protein
MSIILRAIGVYLVRRLLIAQSRLVTGLGRRISGFSLFQVCNYVPFDLCQTQILRQSGTHNRNVEEDVKRRRTMDNQRLVL